MKDDDKNWPSWRYGPKGERAVFDRAEDVPAGWKEHPSLHEKQTGAKAATADQGGGSSGQGGDTFDVDAHGHPWSADLHAGTKAQTKEGLWRMKVGVSRPDPLPGFPKPAVPNLDL